jgi:hypothetical protein
MIDNKWFSELKVGDKFFTEEFGRYYVYKVKKVTKTEVVTEPLNEVSTEGPRFGRESAMSLGGGSWHRQYARQLTPENTIKIIKAKRINFIRSYNEWGKLDENCIKSIYNLIKTNKIGD